LFFATKNHFFATVGFLPLFLNEGSRIRKNRLQVSRLYFIVQRYTGLIKAVQLERQCLQSYDGVLEFFRPKFEFGWPNVLNLADLGFEFGRFKDDSGNRLK
jgi:hypothetical protein